MHTRWLGQDQNCLPVKAYLSCAQGVQACLAKPSDRRDDGKYYHALLAGIYNLALRGHGVHAFL